MSSAAIRLSLLAGLSHSTARKVWWLIALRAGLPLGSLRALLALRFFVFFLSHVLRPFARVQHTSLSIVHPLFFNPSPSPTQHEEEPSCYFCCMIVSERCFTLATGLFIFAPVRRHLLYLRGSPPLAPSSHASQEPSLCPCECFLRLLGEKQTRKPAFFLPQSRWQKCVWPGTRTFFCQAGFPAGLLVINLL